MQLQHDGITLWFGTVDAPAPEGTAPPHGPVDITVGVSPQDASHTVTIRVRVNGGAVSTVDARWIRSDPNGRSQYFRARLPDLNTGDHVEYTPVCVSAGRRVPAKSPSGGEGDEFAATFTLAGRHNSAQTRAGNAGVPDSRHDAGAAPSHEARAESDARLRPESRRLAATNRKLLVSVFNAQEAREAVLGGARIVDSEDPRSALGNIRPVQIMAISDAVLDFKRNLDVQLSTNIGEDQLLFRRSPAGQAIEKSPYEIAGKASQAAIGVSTSMGTNVHPCNIVKVGLDCMDLNKLVEVLSEVVSTLRRTEQFSHSQVMSVLFAQDVALWEERKNSDQVRRVLVELHEFYPAAAPGPHAFDLRTAAVGTLRDAAGRPLFTQGDQVSLGALVRNNVLPPGSNNSLVQLNPLFDHRMFFPGLASGAKTNRAVIKAMVDATADAGAQAIMLDTSILSKVANICLVDTSGSEMVDLNRHRMANGLLQRGILTLADIHFFVEYCHYRGVAANLAGSVESYQAQQLWALVPEADQISTRGSASGIEVDPSNPTNATADTRQHRIIKRSLVCGLAPPEHGGVLNLPAAWLELDDARHDSLEAARLIDARRRDFGWPDLVTYFVDARGHRVATMDLNGRVARADVR